MGGGSTKGMCLIILGTFKVQVEKHLGATDYQTKSYHHPEVDRL